MTPVSLQVVEAIAEAEGVDPASLTPPLATVIDPTALDELAGWGPDDNQVRVSFRYPGYVVDVEPDGSVRVSQEETVDASPESAQTD